MYLEHLRLWNLKLIEDLRLDFTGPDGALRKWTVIIGPNGTAKTSILQAIALAAVGPQFVSDLANGKLTRLRSLLPPPQGAGARDLKIQVGFTNSADGKRVEAQLTQQADRRDMIFSKISDARPQPLWEARVAATEPPGWFAAGYGVARNLPAVGEVPILDNPPLERLGTLFNHRQGLISTNFVDLLEGKRQSFLRELKQILTKVEGVLPAIDDLELRGRGGVRTGGELQERNRFSQRVGAGSLKIPAIELSHGYQSTIAWIADLLGHLLLAHPKGKPFKAAKARGLVLIDELDLHLHPKWQVGLIRALRTAFPELQFIVATHSPLLLAGLDPAKDQIIDLEQHPDTGLVRRREPQGDPRLMSGSQLYARYFQLPHTFVGEEGRWLQQYSALAGNPYRTQADQAELQALAERLTSAGVSIPFPPVDRRAA